MYDPSFMLKSNLTCSRFVSLGKKISPNRFPLIFSLPFILSKGNKSVVTFENLTLPTNGFVLKYPFTIPSSTCISKGSIYTLLFKNLIFNCEGFIR